MAEPRDRDVKARNLRRSRIVNSTMQHVSRGLDGHFDVLIVRFDHLRGEADFERLMRQRGHVDLKGEQS